MNRSSLSSSQYKSSSEGSDTDRKQHTRPRKYTNSTLVVQNNIIYKKIYSLQAALVIARLALVV